MNEKINELIEHYTTILQKDPNNENEVYKWYAIAHFQQHWVLLISMKCSKNLLEKEEI